MMMKTYCFVFFIVATYMVHAEKRNTASLMSTIRNLYFKLCKSIQREANAIKSATFETQWMRLQYSYEQQAKQKSRFVRRQRCIEIG